MHPLPSMADLCLHVPLCAHSCGMILTYSLVACLRLNSISQDWKESQMLCWHESHTSVPLGHLSRAGCQGPSMNLTLLSLERQFLVGERHEGDKQGDTDHPP